MSKNLFLYLTLACFVGLIAVFIVDGYLGIHDTLYMTTGELEERIESDEWQQQEKYGIRGVSVNHGEKASLKYEVDNRRFSGYTADIEVSVWRSREKVSDIVSAPMEVGAFAKGQVEWIIDTKEILPGDASPEQSYQFTVIIERGEIERKIIMYINPLAYPVKPVPVR